MNQVECADISCLDMPVFLQAGPKNKRQWYIVQTKPLCEQQVKLRWLQAGYEVFLPQIRKKIRTANGPVERVKALFPSYIFICVDLHDSQHFRNIKYTRGVNKVLGVGHVPMPMAPEIIQLIKSRVDQTGVLEEQVLFHKGDQVRIRSGVLGDLVGVLEKPVSDQGRVKVLLEVFHKVVRAEFDCSEVEKIAV